MLEKVRNTIRQFNMISEGDTVLCGLSGGADSVTLLLCLKELGYNVHACHVNHMLRGEESDRDELFCKELCASLDVPFTVKRVNVKKYCEQSGTSVEEGARVLRYKAFDDISCDKIATAHTLSDCFETAIFNLTRGTGLTGMCSIPPVRDKIIRPLVNCTRQEIEQFLKQRGQSFVTDSTNLINDCSRNKIRNLVVPVLQEINPAAVDNFANALNNFRADEKYLSRLADELLVKAASSNGYSCEVLSEAAEPVLPRVVISLLKQNGVSYSSERVDKLIEIIRCGGREQLNASKTAVSSMGCFRITSAELLKGMEYSQTIAIDDEYDFFGRTVSVELVKKSDIIHNVHKKFANCMADYDKIKGEILLRNRRAGDKIKLVGREHTSSVKKLFNADIPLEKRDMTVMLADENGLFFVEGYGAAERVCVDDSTQLVLICKIS